MPLEEEMEDQDEVREIFNRLFIDGRKGRDLEMEIDNTIEDEEEESESKAIEGAIKETNTQEISRFNNYIDAIYKRMNAALRAKLMDPMVLNLQGKEKKEGSEKKAKDAKKRVDRDVEESSEYAKGDEEEDSEKDMDVISVGPIQLEVSDVEIDHRAGEPKTKQKGNKKEKKEKREKNKNKNKNKKVKDKTKKKEKKNKEGKEEKISATKQKRQENKLKAKKERELAKKEKEDTKAARKLAKAAKADKKAAKAAKKEKDQARESRSREHGQHHNKKKGAKAVAKGRNGAKKEKNGKKDKKNNNKKDKDPKKQKGSKGSKASKASKGKARDNKEVSKESKVMGSLAGIATLRRSGDVTVIDDENHKVVTSSFSVGPIQLEVSKTLGQGKSRTVRTAKATTDVMTGTMVLKVKPDGSAHVKKVVFAKPDHVDVKGSLSDNTPRSITYLKNSVNRMRPMAAQKILKTARYVLKAPATVKQ
jgi:hypothetical protein